MKVTIKPDARYAISGNIVVRQVEDEIILFPYASGEDDSENEPYFLRKTGKIIWKKLEKGKRLQDIINDLSMEFKTPADIIKKDVLKFVEKLVEKKLLVKVSEV